MELGNLEETRYENFSQDQETISPHVDMNLQGSHAGSKGRGG
jgi:hypothetical protein